MTKKLNSYKTYQDKGLYLIIGMIVAYCAMLFPLLWGEAYQAESETETAGTAELWTPGQITEDGEHQVMPPIEKDTPHEKFKEMALAYGLDPSMIWKVEDHYRLTEGMVLCITIAETSGCKRGAGEGNCGNVGNNDRGNRVSYAFLETSLEKIGMTLTNSNLGKKQTLGCLSNRNHCEEPNDNGMRYATSSPGVGHWEPNMVACLSTIYGNINPATFNIRER